MASGKHVAPSPIDFDRLGPWTRSHIMAESHRRRETRHCKDTRDDARVGIPDIAKVGIEAPFATGRFRVYCPTCGDYTCPSDHVFTRPNDAEGCVVTHNLEHHPRRFLS